MVALVKTKLGSAPCSSATRLRRLKTAATCEPKTPRRRCASSTATNDKAPGLFTEGFYRYSVFSTSLDVSNHHLNLLSLCASSFALEIAWSLYAFSL
jgi:hypothetical protein